MIVEDYRTADIASNGDVVFGVYREEPDPYTKDNIFRYRNGEVLQLTYDEGLKNVYPLTDGINVVYEKYGLINSEWKHGIAMHTASGEILLSPYRSQEDSPDPWRDYQVNNGWAAFTKFDESGINQIWMRSPSGDERQITFFSGDSIIGALSPNGEVTFIAKSEEPPFSSLYYGGWDIAPIFIGGEQGHTFWMENEWYKILFRMLFKIDAKDNPSVFVTPTSHNFGWASIGSTAKHETFTITNIGYEDLNVGNVSISGLDLSEFFIMNDNCSGRKLAPFESSTVDVVFSPLSLGFKSAFLSVSSTEVDIKPFKIVLHGGLRPSRIIIISGTIKNSFHEGIAGVSISALDHRTNTSTRTSTGADGDYILDVVYEDSHHVEPYKQDYYFEPQYRLYTNVVSDEQDQDYIGIRIPYAPLNFTYQKVLNRSLFMSEYINILTWKANPESENVSGYKIFKIVGDSRIRITTLDAKTFKFWTREKPEDLPVTYELVAFDDKGREGDPAYLTIND